MNRMAGKVSIVFLIMFLLGGAAPACAFSFCFSLGSSTNQQSRYAAYPPPYPLAPRGNYGVYPYSPQQFDPYYGAYYPPVSPQPYEGGVMTTPEEQR